MLLDLETILSFGKHKGCQLEDVIYDDPQYISWLILNTDHDFDEETLELITKRKIA